MNRRTFLSLAPAALVARRGSVARPFPAYARDEPTRASARLAEALKARRRQGRVNVAAIDRNRILRAARRYLTEQPLTITATRSPRSAGGPHDYFSEGDYWWPDPKNPDGPYIQRDGMTNPDNFVAHRHALIRLSVQMPALAAAWLVTKDKRFAEHAARHLRAWFLDETTRMNPSLLYGQAIQGRSTAGRNGGPFVSPSYEIVMLAEEERERLMRTYDDLMELVRCPVPVEDIPAGGTPGLSVQLRFRAGVLLTEQMIRLSVGIESVVDLIAYSEQDARALVQTFQGITHRIVVLSSMDVYSAYGQASCLHYAGMMSRDTRFVWTKRPLT